MSKELLIKGGHVVAVDPDLGDLPACDVLVADGLITAVGPDLEPTTTAAEVIEAAGRLVIPGMVDTHRHVWQGAIGGYTPQITGAGYGAAVLTGIALKHSPEDVYAGTLWGALQALDAGITTIADWAHNDQSPAHADADLRGLRDSGIRGYFLYGGPGPATDDPNPPHPADARRMRDQYFASGTYGRLRMGMALRGPCFTSGERNAEDYAFARDLGLPISVHVGMADTADAITTLQRYHLLGADVNYVHANLLTDREFDLIAETQGTVTITPSTDMLMQFGTFPATGQPSAGDPSPASASTPSAALATTCSPRCAWPWPQNGPEPTRRPWPAASRSPPWTCTSGTCCAWPPSTEPGCGTSKTRSAPSRQVNRLISRSSTCDPRTSTGSATRSPSWSSEPVPPTLKR